MNDRKNDRMRALIGAALAAAAIALVLLNVLVDDEPTAAPPAATKVDGADRDRKRDDRLKLTPEAERVVESQEALERAGGADPTATPERGTRKAGPHPDVVPDTTKELRGKDRQPAGVIPEGGGAQGFPGCATRFVGSYSQRGGATIKAIVLHYTAGPNLPGLADMNGLTAYSNRNQVSWHFLIDREGHCYYSVPLAAKAWTVGNLNPETVNIEVVGRGNEPGYAGEAGMAKLSQVVRELGRRSQIPIALGAVSNCRVTRRGIVTHWMGGGCSGGHHDIKPYSITGVIGQIKAGGGPSTRLLKVEREVAEKRCYHRAEHVAGRDRAENLKWARHYRARILIPDRRTIEVGGHLQLVPRIDAAKRADGKPWSYRHRGARRAELLRVRHGRGC